MVIRMLFVASANTHFSSLRLTLLSAASSANSREKCLRPKQGTILQVEQPATWLQVGHSGSVLSQRTEIHPHCMLALHVSFREQIFQRKRIECKDVHMGCDRHDDLWDPGADSRR